jgi:uncharacterized protein (UPF0261 family)
MLFDSIRSEVSTLHSANVKLVEIDVHINDPVFADRLVEEFNAISGGQRIGAKS